MQFLAKFHLAVRPESEEDVSPEYSGLKLIDAESAEKLTADFKSGFWVSLFTSDNVEVADAAGQDVLNKYRTALKELIDRATVESFIEMKIPLSDARVLIQKTRLYWVTKNGVSVPILYENMSSFYKAGGLSVFPVTTQMYEAVESLLVDGSYIGDFYDPRPAGPIYGKILEYSIDIE